MMQSALLAIPEIGSDVFALSDEALAGYAEHPIVDSSGEVRGRVIAARQLSDRVELDCEVDDGFVGFLIAETRA